MNTKFFFHEFVWFLRVYATAHGRSWEPYVSVVQDVFPPKPPALLLLYSLQKLHTWKKKREEEEKEERGGRSIFYQAMNRRERGGEKEGVYIYIYICIYPSARFSKATFSFYPLLRISPRALQLPSMALFSVSSYTRSSSITTKERTEEILWLFFLFLRFRPICVASTV